MTEYRSLISAMTLSFRPSCVCSSYLFLLIVAVTRLISDTSSSHVTSFRYKRRSVCGVQDLIDKGCIGLATNSSIGALRCATLCQEKAPMCKGVVTNDEEKCYFYYECDENQNRKICSAEDASYAGYRIVNIEMKPRYCFNDGVFNRLTKLCECRNYWMGEFCERRPTSCEELRDSGYYPPGDHWAIMNVLGQPSVNYVKCSFDTSYVKTYISVSNGKGDFNMTYEDYKKGFAHGPDAFWLGLDNVHLLNAAGFDYAVLTATVQGVELTTTYKSVSVQGESVGYQIYYTSVILNGNELHVRVEECLPKNARFSTWDNDDDDEDGGRNLAAESGSGWWFGDLSLYCNPNGKAPRNISFSDQLEFVSIRGVDLAYNALGQHFENVTFYFWQI